MHLLVHFIFFLLLIGPTLGSAEPLRIAFGSCIKEPHSQIFSAISKHDPDLLFLLGDTVYYPDNILGNEQEMRSLFKTHLETPTLQALLKSTTHHALWDDHDYGANNVDSLVPYRAITERVFRSLFSIPEHPEGFSKGIHRSFVQRNVRFILTDNRSFRVNPNQGKPSAHFGAQQLSWIESLLAKDDVPTTVLVSGGQILNNPGPTYESLAAYPHEHERLITALSRAPSQVVILSGDKHFADIVRLRTADKELIEASSSPLSANLKSPKLIGNPKGRIASFTTEQNFGLLEIDHTKEPRDMSIKIHTKTRPVLSWHAQSS